MATRIKSNQITDNVITADDLHSAIAINTTASGTFGSVVVDNITVDGSTITNSTGNLIIDSAGDISLNADGADVILADGSVDFGRFKRDAGDFVIKAETVDKDIILRGTKAGSPNVTIDALLFDMSNDGRATFSENVITTGTLAVNGATMGSGFEFQVNGDARITNYIEASSATFGNTTLTGFLRGPGTFTIDPAGHGDNTGTVVIAGNLQVDGTTTTINSTTVDIDDLNITVAKGSGSAATADGAGLYVDIVGTANPHLSFDGSNDRWRLNRSTHISLADNTAYATTTDTRTDGSRLFIQNTDNTDDTITGITLLTGSSVGSAYEINAIRSATDFKASLAFKSRTATGTYAEHMRIDDDGNVGIGTDTPDAPLEVDFTSTTVGLKLTRSDANGNSSIQFANNQGLKNVLGYNAGTGGFTLADGSNNNRLSVNANSGNLGIGYDTAKQKLEVNGAFQSTQYTIPNSGSPQWVKLGELQNFVQGGQSAKFRFVIATGYNAQLAQSYEIDLYIKTSNGSPNSAGQYFTSYHHRYGRSGATPTFKWKQPTAGSNTYELHMMVPAYASGSHYVLEKSNGRWSSSGSTSSDPGVDSTTVFEAPNIGKNVLGTVSGTGFGIINPNVDMDGIQINGDSGDFTNWTMRVKGRNDSKNGIIIDAGANNNQYPLWLRKHNETTIMTARADGRVGIGTDQPNEALHVMGDTVIQGGSNTTNTSELGFTNAFDTAFIRSKYYDPASTTETYLAFHTNTSGAANGTVAEQMRIKGNKVGIGTTVPTAKLHVHDDSTTTDSATLVNRTSTAFGWEEEYWFNARVTASTAGTAYVTFQFSNPATTNLHNMHIDYTFGLYREHPTLGSTEGDTVKGTGSYHNTGGGGDTARSGEAEVIGVGIVDDVYIETTGTYAFRLAIVYEANSAVKNISGKIKLLNNPATGTSPAVTVTV
jgi:hypothetical protein